MILYWCCLQPVTDVAMLPATLCSAGGAAADADAGPLKHKLLLLLHSADLLLKSTRAAECAAEEHVAEADGGAAGATAQIKCCCRSCLRRVSLDQLQPKLPPQ